MSINASLVVVSQKLGDNEALCSLTSHYNSPACSLMFVKPQSVFSILANMREVGSGDKTGGA